MTNNIFLFLYFIIVIHVFRNFSTSITYYSKILNFLIWPKRDRYDFEIFGQKESRMFKDIVDVCVNKIILNIILDNQIFMFIDQL